MKKVTPQLVHLYLTLCLFLAVNHLSIAQTSNRIVYQTAGNTNFTVPPCISEITIETWGGGGGGGGNNTNDDGGGGGGGGAYAKRVVTGLTGGEVFAVTVGAGGGAGTPAANGGNGGASEVRNPANVVVASAEGGRGGARANGGASSAGGAGGTATVGDVGYSGGAGGNSINDIWSSGGGGGSSAGYNQAGNNGTNAFSNNFAHGAMGGAAPSGGARGGSGGATSSGCNYQENATVGLPGGGGGGGAAEDDGSATNNGAAGGVGKVIITYGSTRAFTAVGATNWTVPAGVTRLTAQIWGAGGGGGGNHTDDGGGGGGGGGGYTEATLVVAPGQNYVITVGAGGAGGTDQNNATGDGTVGAASSVNGPAGLVTALGGGRGTRRGGTRLGGAGAAAGVGGNIAANTGGNGGNGFNDNWGHAGGGGGSAGPGGNGGNGGNPGGSGCGAFGGTRGNGAAVGGGDGGSGNGHYNFTSGGDGPGGGGAGAAERNVFGGFVLGGFGGDGADGFVQLTWSPSFALSSSSTSATTSLIGAASTCPVNNHPIHAFMLQGVNFGGCPLSMNVTSIRFVTTGTYQASDILGFKLYKTTTGTFATTTLVATLPPSAAGAKVFTGLNETINNLQTYYWVAVDINPAAVGGRTIRVNMTNDTDITGDQPIDPSTSAGQSGLQTIIAGPTFTSSHTPPAICSGATFAYTATATAGGGNPITYAWTRNVQAGITQGASSGTTANISEMLTNTTTAPINVSYNFVTSELGCQSFDTVVVIVNPVPTANVTGTAAFCQTTGGTTNFILTGSNATPPYTFTYNINGTPGTAVSAVGVSTVSVAQATSAVGTFTLNLTNVAIAACNQNVTSTAVVTVNGSPTATSAGAATLCATPGATNIVFTASNGVPPYTFSYSLNGTPTTIVSAAGQSTVSIPQSTATAGTFTYSLTDVADASCNRALTEVEQVTINAVPSGTVTGTATFCETTGGTTDFILTGSNATPPYIFTYSLNGAPATTISTGAVSTVSIAQPTTTAGTYTLNITNVATATCNQNITSNAVVTVNGSPTATSAGSATMCATPGTTNIVFTATNGTPPYTFTYSLNGTPTTIVSAAGQSTVSIPQSTAIAGTFTYSLTDVADASCNRALTESEIILINPIPTASITGEITVCQNAISPDITFTGAGGTSPYVFNFTEDGVPQTVPSAVGEATVAVQASTATPGIVTYNIVSVEDANGCTQTQTGSQDITVLAPLTATVTSSDRNVCEGEATTWTFTGGSGTPNYIFNYTVDSLRAGTQSTGTISTSGGASSVVLNTPNADNGDTVVVTINGISDNSGFTCPVAVASFDTLTINTIPISSIVAAFQNVCAGDPGPHALTFTANGTPALPVTFNYSTITNGGALVTQPALTVWSVTYDTTIFVPTPAGGDVVVYTNGTSTSAMCVGSGSGSDSIKANPIPTAAIVGTATICDDNTTAVTFTGAVGTPPFTFTYNIDGGAAQTVTSLSGQYSANIVLDTVPGTYVVNLLAVSDTFGCNQAQAGNVTVIVDPLPAATAGGNSSMCLNGTATVAGATFANGTISWTHNGSGNLTNVTTLTPTYTAGTADAGNAITLTMTITSDNSCNPETATATYTVNVDSLPFASAGGSSVICENSNHTLSGANARYGSILWTHNGTGSITNATTLTPTYSAAAGDAGNTVTLTMTVTSTNSCAPQIATANYTINVDRLPTATSAGNTTVCQNTPYTLTNGEATMTNAVVQSWNENGAGSITAGGTSLTPSYTPAVADAGSAVTLTLTVISNNTCSLSSTPTASATYTINIDRLPTATSPGSSTTCQNMATTVTTATQTNGNPTWGHNGTGTITNGNTLTPTYTPGAADASLSVVLTLTVTSSNTCSLSTAPTATSTYTVNVDPLPTATITGSSTICQNMTTTVNTASLTNGTPAWTDNGIGTITSGANSLTPTYSAAADDAGNTVTLTMTVMSNNSCSLSPTPTATASYPVTIDPIPTATGGSGTPVCYDQPAVVSGMGLTNGIPTWTENGAGTLTNQNTQNPTYTPNISDAGNPILLTMTVTSNNTCSLSAVPTATATYTFSVRSLMTVTMDVIPSKGWVCQGDEAKLNFKVSNGSGQGPYQIGYNSPGGSSTASSVGNNQTIITDVNTDMPGVNTFTLTSVSDKFCTQQISATATLTVLALPEATVIGGVGVCKGALSPEVTFIGSSANPPASPYKIDFTINGKNASISTRVGQDSVNLTSPTDVEGSIIYTITQVTDANGCSQQISGQSTTMDVYVVPLADFTISTENTSILRPEVDVYDASASGQSWLWDFGDGSLSNLPDPLTHSYADTGIYTISLLLTNGVCRDSTYQVVRIYFPKMLYIPSAFTPNDDGNNDVFQAKGDGFTDYEMMVFDRWGMLIFYSDDIEKGWDGKANGGSQLAQEDVYIYVVSFKAVQDKHDYTYRGTVSLVK